MMLQADSVPSPTLVVGGCCALLVLLCPQVSIAFPTGTTSSETHIAEGVRIPCLDCPVGQMVDTYCTELLTLPVCKPCPRHYFSDVPNGQTYCKACRSSCPKNSKTIQNCTTTTDMMCECYPGFKFHRHSHDDIDPTYSCKQHTSCDSGYGVKAFGNHTHDTSCHKCLEGSEFVNTTDAKHPKCQACSSCPPGRAVLVACTLDSDTQCQLNSTTTNTTTDNNTNTNTTAVSGRHGDSDGLGGGAIAGIIIAFIVIIAIIAGIVYYIRRQKRQHSSTKDVELVNGKLLPPNWTEDFILSKVFVFLSDHMGNEWTHFIRQLPGKWDINRVNAVIDHKKQEEMNSVKNQIYGCLTEWKKECPESVTRENIHNTLKAREFEGLIEKLEELEEQELQG